LERERENLESSEETEKKEEEDSTEEKEDDVMVISPLVVRTKGADEIKVLLV
jgi:hypothetical protein